MKTARSMARWHVLRRCFTRDGWEVQRCLVCQRRIFRWRWSRHVYGSHMVWALGIALEALERIADQGDLGPGHSTRGPMEQRVNRVGRIAESALRRLAFFQDE